MSNFLAVATVTEALRHYIERNLTPGIGFQVTVRAQKPPTEPPAEATITVFCYQVSPNPALRNRDAPTRGPDGALLTRPQAVLDLHYLISFYGDEALLQPQQMLGAVVRSMHEWPVLSDADIAFAAGRPFLLGSDLPGAVDRVRFTPTHLDIDDSYKLWTMLSQTPFALSLTYQASVVAIDGTNVPAAGKPVLQRTVRAVPGGRPAVARVLAQRAGQDPVEGPVPSDSAIVVEGANLAASAVWGQFGDTVVAADTVHDDRVLLHAPETLPAGVYPLRIRQDVQAGPATTMARVLESNAVAFVRQPRVVSATPDASGPAVEVQLDVPVADRARVRLLLDELDVPAGATARGYEFDAPFPLTGRADPHTVRVAVAGVVPGRYLVRVDADGAQSPLEQDAAGRFSGPVIDLSGLRP